MDKTAICEQLSKIMDEHSIERALFIVPGVPTELNMISVNVSLEEVRQIGHMIANNLPDDRGSLN